MLFIKFIAFVAGFIMVWYGIDGFTCHELFETVSGATDGSFLISLGSYIIGTVIMMASLGREILSHLMTNACRDR